MYSFDHNRSNPKISSKDSKDYHLQNSTPPNEDGFVLNRRRIINPKLRIKEQSVKNILNKLEGVQQKRFFSIFSN